MKEHQLKIAPTYFNEVLSGNKTFEIRKNDRQFESGDLVVLEEFIASAPLGSWLPELDYTGRAVSATVGYVCDFNQPEGYVVFSLLNVRIK